EADTKKRAVKRAASVIRGAIYLVITGSTITFLASDGASSSSGEPAPYTARVMAHSGGRWLVEPSASWSSASASACSPKE
ncbi:DUF1206 domain-containing protein, partial [Parafrankia sp. CH37]|uniref:DUF1206 domain-containing protein n=1 Tax=Parafrankia sp. CH37 TaxID=683308 RepID=UPI0037C6E71C